MQEIILNIYLIIQKGSVVAFKAKSYEHTGDDEAKIKFLKSRAKDDFKTAVNFDAPKNKFGKFITYNRFAKFEKQGMHFELFEEIFRTCDVPENPLICVTPVVDGEVLSQ